MSSFAIKVGAVNQSADEIKSASSELANLCDGICNIKNGLAIHSTSAGYIKNRLQTLIEKCEDNQNDLRDMSEVLKKIADLYCQTEKKIMGNEIIDGSLGNGDEIVPDDSVVDDDSVWDYILDALEQIILGNFSDESNMLGIIGSVLVGCSPLGPVADLRDILGDIYNLIEDDATTEEWISLVVDVVALIPLCDLLKHADKLDEFAAIIEAAKGQWKNVDDVISKIDDFITKGADWLDDAFNSLSDSAQRAILKNGKRLHDFLTVTIGDSNVGGVIIDVGKEIIQDGVIGVISDQIDKGKEVISEVTGVISDGLEDMIGSASDTVKCISDWTSDISDEYLNWLKCSPAC